MKFPNTFEIKAGLTFEYRRVKVVVDRKDGNRLWWVYRYFPSRRPRHGKMSERSILVAVEDNPTVTQGPIPGIPGHGAAKGMQMQQWHTARYATKKNRNFVRNLNRELVHMQ